MKPVIVLLRPDERPQPAFLPGLKKPFPGFPAGAGGAETSRKKLWDLSPNLYCSIIGTCLTSEELRKIIQKCKGEDLSRLSEHDLHTEAVHVAAEKDRAGKLLNKALDRRHEAAIQRFDKAKSFEELLTLWNESKRRGDVAGAYWAGITHRKSNQEFIRIAFGDIHMLSHLVASSSRADLRRLSALESERSEAARRIDELQERLHEALGERDDAARKLETALLERAAVPDPEPGDAIARPRDLAAQLQGKLSAEIARRERAEGRLDSLQHELDRVSAELHDVLARAKDMQMELDAAEAQLRSAGSPEGGADAIADCLRGAGILYVGGRTGQAQEIQALVVKSGGEFLHHDGGVEHRRGLLAGMVSRADAVFFPVDCVSHDAVGALKRFCRQAGKPYFPLRTTSLTSFSAGLKCFADSARQR